jgi:gliding motility-associated-like protein
LKYYKFKYKALAYYSIIMENDFCCCCSKFKYLTLTLLAILTLNSSYLHAQVLINEVNVRPGTNATSAQFQSLKDCANPTFGNEYIELYNADPCNAVDISCYLIATPYSGITANSQGSFRFPAGTSIPPLGFISIGGANSGATFLLPAYCTGPNSGNLVTGGSRWFLDNFDQYVALYSANGTPLDVVYWTTSAGQASRWNNVNYDGLYLAPTTIANPTSCTSLSTLAGPQTFPNTIVNYAGAAPSLATVIHRVQDGSSTWATNATPTINSCNGTCVTPTTFTISATTIAPTCSSNNGSISINVTPAGNYTYTWSNNVSTSATANGLGAGNYSVTVSAGGCQKDTTITLTSPNGPTNITVSPTNPTCNQSNGSVVLSNVIGGTGPYTYNFNSLGYSATDVYSNLPAGTYTLLVQDAAGCIYSAPAIVINNSNGPTAVSVTPVNASCGLANGSVNIGLVTGGVGPYQYNFNNLGFSNTSQFQSLAEGSYPLVINDSQGCTYTAPNVVIAGSLPITDIIVNITNPGCGLPNGSVTLGNVTGGVGPYTYNFNNTGFFGSSIFNNLNGGSYSLIVQDALGCTYTAPNIILNSLNGPTGITLSATNSTCGLANGAITVTSVIGGTLPYQYAINGNNLSPNDSFTNISANNYTITVQDSAGCTFSDTISVFTTPAITSANVITTPANCARTGGSININGVIGGTATYQYNFDNGGLTANTLYDNLGPGTYTIIIQDINGCQLSLQETIAVDNSNGPNNINYTFTSPGCEDPDGKINITNINGGTAPYLYSFNNGPFVSATEFNSLPVGSYTITVQDANGCEFSTTAVLPPKTGEDAYYTPNSFTPNGDNTNETWTIKGNCILAIDCVIFNRWGEEIATINSPSEFWDGNYKNQKAMGGIYCYKAKITFQSGIEKIIFGHINLIN